jgi:ribulose 1,5-bisphosphate carboxylase large subunit-like protein
VKAGVESIREAWAAAFDGESLESRARSKPALAAALAFFQ